MRWTVCLLPPIAVFVLEETPGLSGLDGINAAGLIFLSPLLLIFGFVVTAAIIMLARWLVRWLGVVSRFGFAALTLAMVGVLSPIAYIDHDWLLLGVIELASTPAAFLLAPRARTMKSRV